MIDANDDKAIEISTETVESADGMSWLVNLYINSCEIRLAGKHATKEIARGSAYNVRLSVMKAIESSGRRAEFYRKPPPPPKMPGTMLLGPLSQKCKIALFNVARIAGGAGEIELSETLSNRRTFIAVYVAAEIEKLVAADRQSSIDFLASETFTAEVAEQIGDYSIAITQNEDIWQSWITNMGDAIDWYLSQEG